MRLYGRTWLVVAVLLGALGTAEVVLAVPPLSAWTAGVAVAALAALSHLCFVAHREPTRAPGLGTLRVAALGGLAGTTMTGLTALLGAGGAALLFLLVLGHPRLLRGAAGQARRLLQLTGVAQAPGKPAPRPAAATALVPGPAPTPPQVTGPAVVPPRPSEERRADPAGVQGLTLPELCWGWRASFIALERADAQTEYRRWVALVAVRRCYLDEIARRDPAGLARWLYAGARPASDPSRYLARSVGLPSTAVPVLSGPAAANGEDVSPPAS